jgi:hypothetical protein
MNALDAALYAKFAQDTGAGGLFNSGTPLITGAFNRLAPEGQAFPYLIWQTPSATDYYTLTKLAKTRHVVTVKIVDKGTSSKTAGAALDRVAVLLTDGTLAVTGFTVLVSRREQYRQRVEVDDGIEYPVEEADWGVELTQ